MVPLKSKNGQGGINIKDEVCNLIKKYLSLIYKYLISIGASKEDAEDIIQETFIKTYENIDILIDGNIKAWMFKVSINRFYTLYKKSRVNISLTDELASTIQSDFKIMHIDNALEVNKVLSLMKESEKNLWILKYSMGLSYRCIGSFLNIEEGSAKTLCYRARNKFKLVEMAVSFDKDYIFEDINNAINNKLITFYWVDNNSEEEKQRVIEDRVPAFNVAGIKAASQPGQFEHGPNNLRENFKETVRKLKEIGHDQYVENINENNFKISGIVVVGSPKELKAIQNNPMIKHAVIGTVADKY